MSKGARTRRRIVDVARGLFHARGYTNTSIDDIVRTSRVTKGSLYHYFASKEDLGHAVVEAAIAEQFGSGPRDEAGHPVDRVVRMFKRTERALAEGRCKGGCLLGNLALEVSDVHDGFRQRLGQAFVAWEEQVSAILADGVQGGFFTRELDPRSTARFVVATLEGGILLAKVTRKADAITACSAMVERVLDGFKPTSR